MPAKPGSKAKETDSSSTDARTHIRHQRDSALVILGEKNTLAEFRQNFLQNR
jgi:hypothetical protein